MIYTVTLNPSLDYVVTVDHFITGKVNRTSEERILPGGKGINVSIVLRNLGYPSTALGFVAGFTGDKLQQILTENGIVTDFIRVENGMSRINVKLRSDQESEINGKGPRIEEKHLRMLFQRLDKVMQGDILVLAGSIPGTMPSSTYMHIMKYLAGSKVDIVVDATGELLMNVLQYRPFLIKPNHHELAEIFQTDIKKKEEVIYYGKKLQEKGARNVLVSMAGDGAVLLTEDGTVLQAEAPKGTVRNSVGAGDSMVAGFVAGFLKNRNYEEAFKMGVCAGSASAFSEELATKAEVQALAARFGR